MKPLHVAAETAQLKTVQTVRVSENCNVLNLKHPLEPSCVKLLAHKVFFFLHLKQGGNFQKLHVCKVVFGEVTQTI